MALQTTVERVDGRVPITVLALDGELDASNFESVIEEVRGLYAAGDRTLLLDLSGLTFMASSGLVALHTIVLVMKGEEPQDTEGWSAFHALSDAVDAGERQTEVQLCGVQPAVIRVLERTGLDRLFVVHPDRATAIAAI
ncbi:MAG: STAS domain-containing protein [Chloroflexota bacterium]